MGKLQKKNENLGATVLEKEEKIRQQRQQNDEILQKIYDMEGKIHILQKNNTTLKNQIKYSISDIKKKQEKDTNLDKNLKKVFL